MAVSIEAFHISKISVTPFTKRDFIKNNYKVIFMINIKYRGCGKSCRLFIFVL